MDEYEGVPGSDTAFRLGAAFSLEYDLRPGKYVAMEIPKAYRIVSRLATWGLEAWLLVGVWKEVGPNTAALLTCLTLVIETFKLQIDQSERDLRKLIEAEALDRMNRMIKPFRDIG